MKKVPGVSAMSQAATHILGNQRGAGGEPQSPGGRRVSSPVLSAEEFFEQNAEHLRMRNAELASMAAKRRPQRGEDRELAMGPVPDYILAKRGTQAKGGHHHERCSGIKPAPRGALAAGPETGAARGEGFINATVIDRTNAVPTLVDLASDEAPHANRSPQRESRVRPDRSRLIPYHMGIGGREAFDIATQQIQKQKELQAKGWRIVGGGNGAVQRWVSPLRPMKPIVGLDAAYEEAFLHRNGGDAAPTMQVIQVKQVCAPSSHQPPSMLVPIPSHSVAFENAIAAVVHLVCLHWARRAVECDLTQYLVFCSC